MSLSDDFESYSVGAHPPFGSWTSPFLNPNLCTIVAGGTETGGVGSTKCLQILGGSLVYDTLPAFSTSASVFFAFYADQSRFASGETLELFDFVNGPNGSSQYASLLSVRLETDTTMSCYAGSQFVCNSIDKFPRLQTWNFLQINVTFSTATILGVDFVHVVVHVALNGEEIMSSSGFDTTLQVSLLLGTAAKVNIFRLRSNSILIDNFKQDTLQAIVTYPNPGTPKNKVYQGSAELPLLPDSALLNIFQGPAEINILPDNVRLRAIQGVVELLHTIDVTPGLWKVKEI